MATVQAFKCMRTGLLFPADYVEQWGRKYGIGLGDVPVSEALTNNYYSKSARNSDGKEMYPVASCRAGIQMVEVDDKDFEKEKAVLAIDDPGMGIRGPIMRARQVEHGKVAA